MNLKIKIALYLLALELGHLIVSYSLAWRLAVSLP